LATNLFRIARKVKETGAGVTASYFVDLSAVAKQNCGKAPYCVPNEYICGQLGRFLGLPVPPVGIMTTDSEGKDVWIASLDFNFRGLTLPPVDPDACARELAWLSTGLIVFDILIGNLDRHPFNFAVDFG
jgi:hypothetical protein